MEKVFIKLTGPDNLYPARANLKEGDSVKLFQDANNKHSENAVQITTVDNQILGYVSENADAKHSAKSSKEIYVSFGASDYLTGIVTKSLGMSRGSTQFLVEVLLNPMTNGQAAPKVTDTDTQFVEMELGGARSVYKELATLTADIALDGKKQEVEVVSENGKLIAMYNGGKAGVFKESDAKTMFTLADGDSFIPAKDTRMENELLIRIVTEFGQEGTKFEGHVLLEGKSLKAYIALPKNVRDEASIRYGVGEVITRVVSEGICDEKTAKKIFSVMQENGFDEDLVKRCFATFTTYPEEYKQLIPKEPDTLFIGKELVHEVMFYLSMGERSRHLLFEGAKGLGKNVLAEQAAWMLQRPLLELAVNSGTDNTSLFGSQTVSYDDKGQMTIEYSPEVLIRGAEVGAIVVVDEMNTGIQSIFSGANGLWDKRGRISVPGYRTVVAHKNFATISTINPGYTGTMDLNEATAERFIPILFESDVLIKDIIIKHFPKVSKRNLNLLGSIFDDMQKLVRDGRIEATSITIRGMIDAAEATTYGMKLHKALITNVANRSRDYDDRKTLKNLITDSVGNE